jgi:hypothetical protein
MAITTYAELQTAITNWSHRADLASLLPDFIVLAEAKLNRNLRTRNMETTTTLTPTAGVCTLPTDFLEIRRVYINSSVPIELEYMNPETFYLNYPITAGSSKYFTIEGDSLLLANRSNATALSLLYYKKIPDLATNSTNWLLTSHPDLYLAGAMAELSDFIKDRSGVELWNGKATAILESLKSSDKHGKFSGSALRVVAA